MPQKLSCRIDTENRRPVACCVISSVRWLIRVAFCAGVLAGGIAGRAASTNAGWAVHPWQSDDGLPNNNVTALARTPDGYLWVASPAALARFDGVRFEKFSSLLFGFNQANRIHSIAESRSGGLWFALERGTIVYSDPRQVRIFTNGLPNLAAQALIEDNDGSVWAVFILGIVCHIQTNGEVIHFTERDGMPDGPVCSLAKDSHGGIWFAKSRSGQKVAQVGNYRAGRFQTLLSFGRATVRIAAARDGDVWICNGSQLLKYHEGSQPEDLGNFSPDRQTSPTVLFEDNAGSVWIGTIDDGVYRFNGKTFEHIVTSHPQISALLEDREGNIWAGTFGGGINRIRPRGVELQGQEQGLPFQTVRSLTQDTHGILWAATENGLLANYQDGAWNAITNPPWSGNYITSAAADHDGNVWIGTQNHTLFHIRNMAAPAPAQPPGLNPTNSSDVLPIILHMTSRVVRSILTTESGDVWTGGESPLSLQRLRDGQFKTFSLPPGIRTIRAMAEDAAGNVWVGSSGGLLLRVDNDKVIDETARTSGEPDSIRALCATPDGALCIGYAGNGLGYLKNGRFTRFTTAQGLFDDYISQVVLDEHGWLWFGGDRGIFKIRQEELDAVVEGRSDRVRPTHYGRDEGLLSLQANFDAFPGGIRSRDGRVWIPMRTALAVVDPDVLRENSGPPPVLLRQVTVDDQIVAGYGGALPVKGAASLQLARPAMRLPPTHRRLEFDFTAFNLSAPENVHFRYRLDGFDENWTETADVDNLRKASYPRLPAGNYRFRVTACNSDGIWSDKGAEFTFIVSPFFWQTWWFQSMTVIAFTLVIIAIVRYVSFRRLHGQLRLLEHQAALDKERARIARDLHDDLGGSLTQAGLLLDMTLNNVSPSDNTADGMKKCSAIVRKVAASVDEIIWAINPRNDVAPYLIDYLSQFVVEFLHAAGIQCRVDLPNTIPDKTVSPEVRHNLFLVVKEALNNTARHAGATEVHLIVTADDDQFAIIIEDNGRGFQRAPGATAADGLHNMRQRMEEIGGRFQIESKADAGTRASFIYPWPRDNK